MGEDARATTAAEFRAANRKMVALPSGRTVELRKLTSDFLFFIREMAEEALLSDGTGAGEGVTPLEEVRRQRRFVEALVCRGTSLPRIVPATRAPKEDELNPEDLGADFDPLVKAILDYNGDVLTVPFRPEPAGEPVPPGGEGVRAEAERPGEGGTQ